MIALLEIDCRYFLQVPLGQSMSSAFLTFVVAADDLGDHEGNDHDYASANNLFGAGERERRRKEFAIRANLIASASRERERREHGRESAYN